jgi:hypothetical protein
MEIDEQNALNVL